MPILRTAHVLTIDATPLVPEFIGDARYAMLPTSLEPLWGIVVEPSAPGDAVRFETGRKLTPEIRTRFVEMLVGR